MVDHLSARTALAQRPGVVQVAPHQLHGAAPAQGARFRGIPHQAADLVAPLEQRSNQVGADEPRPARDEGLHSDLS